MAPKYEAAPFGVVRIPLLPIDELDRLSQSLEVPLLSSDCTEGLLGAAWQRDRDNVMAAVRELIARPVICDSIRVASDDLARAIADSTNDESTRRAEAAIFRYVARMSHRPTPFGLFASCTIIPIGDQSRMHVATQQHVRPHVRLDAAVVARLSDRLADSVPPGSMRWIANDTLARVGDRWRYVEAIESATSTVHRQAEAVSSPALDLLIAEATEPKSGLAITRCLTTEFGVDDEEAQSFFSALCEAQVLLPDCRPCVYGGEPFAAFCTDAERLDGTASLQPRLHQLQQLLSEANSRPPGELGTSMRASENVIRELINADGIKSLFHVEAYRPSCGSTIGRDIVEAVLDGIDCLTAFQPSRNRSLREFEERFADRFGDSFVPLPVAVDEDVGIGFSASGLGVADLDPILQGVPVVLPGAETKMLSERDERLIRLLHRHRGDGELTVTPSALGVKPDAQPLAGAITAMLTVLRVGSPDTLSINLQYATGPVGLLLGRFAHGDQGLATELARQIKQEDDLDPSVLVAEIVHAPGQRVVNILSRPILRPFVISYLGRAEGAGVQRLLTSELHVGVVDGRTVLWSPRHQKEVRPRLSSAHAAFNTSNLPVYRFLHALASRDSAQLRWSWGALDVCDKLPRVRSGSVILARARWSIDTDEFRRLKPLLTSPGRLVVALRTFCERHGLPRHVVLVEGDNTIPIDFENALSVESMLRLPLRSDRTMLEESLDAETDWATGADGRYNNEVVLPFTRVRRNGNTEARPTTNIERRALPPTLPILPGGPWLYLKVYCGVAVADRLLIDVLAPCLDRLESDGVTRGWFFLRYNDPQFHLRLRVRGAAKALHEIALPALRSALENEVSAGFVANVEMGSYVPEVRRYGGDTGIGAAEEIFCHDSAAVCAVVSLLREQELDLERNLIIVAAIDATLCEFKLSLADRFKLAERMKDAYQRELFAPGQSLREVLSSKFRDRRKTIEAMLDREARGQPFQMLRSILDRRAASCAGAVAAILQVESEGALTVSIADLLSSVAHMTANRLALALPRHQEFVAYDLLMQHYKSQLARQRQTREQ